MAPDTTAPTKQDAAADVAGAGSGDMAGTEQVCATLAAAAGDASAPLPAAPGRQLLVPAEMRSQLQVWKYVCWHGRKPGCSPLQPGAQNVDASSQSGGPSF